MGLFCNTILSVALLFISKGVSGTTFTFVNRCDYTVWPGILGSPTMDTTGFELTKGKSRSMQAPTGWSGRFWARTGCNFDGSGHGSCSTGDCGSGQIECAGAGATPPATLVEFTLGSSQTLDFYDVSLVDGYNLPMIVEAIGGGSGMCASTGCVADLNQQCPAELRAADGAACRSACEAFGTPESTAAKASTTLRRRARRRCTRSCSSLRVRGLIATRTMMPRVRLRVWALIIPSHFVRPFPTKKLRRTRQDLVPGRNPGRWRRQRRCRLGRGWQIWPLETRAEATHFVFFFNWH
ncbi:similar to THAUMATIN-LIKE PROTEIN 1 [Actinidia rufa]|uniref:Similar to THAUMATIN-LIKE PROTEIN 1 n=1 Tax=Actinidia rufa TaxID=165716 RepID=A0A7J0EN39_9ERIC|nr:similar to THAUMATIN-LIKE PROTEIN 1 [Actinidia rufa]